MTTIRRISITEEEVEVPPGRKPCPYCRGKGKLLENRTSIAPPVRQVLEDCLRCEGLGHVPEDDH